MIDINQIRFQLAKTKLRAPLIWYRHRNLNPDDVYIASYPRSGSTWLRFLLFELLSGQQAIFSSVRPAIPGVSERKTALPLLTNNGHLIQTHEPYCSEYKKAIYLVRDVRDVMVSEYYYFQRRGINYGEFDDFFHYFMGGRVNPFGFWGNHIKSWLKAIDEIGNSLLIVKYENMRENPKEVLGKVLSFLEVERSDEVIQNTIDNNTVDQMRLKEDEAPEGFFKEQRENTRFIREGSTGDWRKLLNPSHAQIIEDQLGDILNQLGYPINKV